MKVLTLILCWFISISRAVTTNKAIDSQPGQFCRGVTTLFKVSDGTTVFRIDHKETDDIKSSPKGPFYGKYRMKPYERGEIKASVTGDCCWKYYSKTGFEGESLLLGLDEKTKSLVFQAMSVNIVECQ